MRAPLLMLIDAASIVSPPFTPPFRPGSAAPLASPHWIPNVFPSAVGGRPVSRSAARGAGRKWEGQGWQAIAGTNATSTPRGVRRGHGGPRQRRRGSGEIWLMCW